MDYVIVIVKTPTRPPLKLGGLLHQIKEGFSKQSQQSQQSLQSEQSHPKPEAFDCLLELIPNTMIQY